MKSKGFCPCCGRFKLIDDNGNMKKHMEHRGVLDRRPSKYCSGVGEQAVRFYESI